MDLAGDRHEVLDVEGVRVEAAVPADHVERVRRVGHPAADQAGRAVAPVLHEHLDVGALDQERLGRVRAGRARSTARARAAGRSGRGTASAGRRGCSPRSRRACSARPGSQRCVVARGTSDVVAGPVGQHAEHRLDGAAALLDVHALVADRVAVVRRDRVGDDVGDPHVAVAEHQPPALHGVDRPLGVLGPEQPVQLEVPRLERVVRGDGQVGQLPDLAVDDRRRHAAVVEQGGVGGEALLPHQLLEAQRAVLVAERGVPLLRDLADLAVVRHRD